MIRLCGAIIALDEDFWGKLWRERFWVYGFRFQWKHQNVVEISQHDWSSSRFCTTENKVTRRFKYKSKIGDRIFTWKPNLGKNHGEEGNNSLLSRSYSEFSRAILCLQSLLLFFFFVMVEGPVYIHLTRCNKGAYIMFQNRRIHRLRFFHNCLCCWLLWVIHVADYNHPRWSKSCCNSQNVGWFGGVTDSVNHGSLTNWIELMRPIVVSVL